MIQLDALLALVPPHHAKQPRFMAMLEAVLAPFVATGNVARDLPAYFDIDTAIGVQLDVVGEWVGRSRRVSLPLAGIYFTWDDDLRGWDHGLWQAPYDTPRTVVGLDDETYRRLLYAIILASRWDGTVPGAQAVFDTFFVDPATRVFIQDNAQVPFPRAFFAWDNDGQGFDEGEWFVEGASVASLGAVDPSMTIGVSGRIPPLAQLGLLAQNALRIKPGGIATAYAVTSVNGAPVFGWDVQNDCVSGWETGAHAVTPDALILRGIDVFQNTDPTLQMPRWTAYA